MTPGIFNPFKKLCRTKKSSPEGTPIRVKSVKFEPPPPDVSHHENDPSHFRFQESDLDELQNSGGGIVKQSQRLPQPPIQDYSSSPNSSRKYQHPDAASLNQENDNDSRVNSRIYAQVHADESMSNSSDNLDVIKTTQRNRHYQFRKKYKKSYTHNKPVVSLSVPQPLNQQISKSSTTTLPVVNFDWLSGIGQAKSDQDGEILLLRKMVHKLNIELSKFQSKELKLMNGDKGCIPEETEDQAVPDWLYDLRRLVPLLVSYEEELAEKNNIISEYEIEVNEIRNDMTEIVSENEVLLQRLDEIAADGPIDPDQHVFLRDNAKLVLEENELLKEKEKNLKERLGQTEEILMVRINRLGRELQVTNDKLDEMEYSRNDFQNQVADLEMERERLKSQLKGTMSVKDHDSSIAECHKLLNDLKDQYEKERKNFSVKVQNDEREVSNLMERLNKSEIHKTQAETEAKVLRKMVRKYEELTLSHRSHLVSLNNEKKKLAGDLNDTSFNYQRMQGEIKQLKNNLRTKESEVNKLNELRSSEMKLLERLHKKIMELKVVTGRRVETIEATLDKNNQTLQEECLQEVKELRTVLREKENKIEALLVEKNKLNTQLDTLMKNV